MIDLLAETTRAACGLAQAGIQRIEGNLKAAVRKKLLTEAKAADARGRLTGTLTYNGFDSVDLVIEAAIEVHSYSSDTEARECSMPCAQ